MSTTRGFLEKCRPAKPSVANRGMFAAALPLMFALAFIWPFGGSQKVQMTPDPNETPGAQGTVSVTRSKNGNTQIDTKVKDLAKPSSLKKPEDVYVEWIQPTGQNPKNEGQIAIQPNETGELKTQTPYKHFKVFLTPETNPRVQSPTGPRVLSATVD